MISLDVEDWYHSEYYRHITDQKFPQLQDSLPPILKLFKEYNTRATFFFLGDVAEKHPALVEQVAKQGHEVASHGYSHMPLHILNRKRFAEELEKTEKAIRKAIRMRPRGFRAPYFSLSPKTAWALKVLQRRGYRYDSSIFPMKTPLYGCSGAPLGPYYPSLRDITKNGSTRGILEFPATLFRLGPLKIPVNGGIYFRVLPFPIIKQMLRSVSKHRPLNVYFHPWETATDLPRVPMPLKNRFVNYYGTGSRAYLKKIENLLREFSFGAIEDYKE